MPCSGGHRRTTASLETNARHPSLHFKKLSGTSPPLWSVRVGLDYRALAVEQQGEVFWFWIGRHAEYDRPDRLAERSRLREARLSVKHG